MELDTDIIRRIDADFSEQEAPLAQSELRESGRTGRVARCIVLASNGSLQRMRELIEMAKLDFRDVIVPGEYNLAMRQVRDLRVSFLVASPGDFWIGETARTMYKHGYVLTQLESHEATVGPFEYTCDQSEGTATFSKGNESLTVKKQDRNWSLERPGVDRCAFGLDQPIDDEERFRVQLDVCLLAN